MAESAPAPPNDQRDDDGAGADSSSLPRPRSRAALGTALLAGLVGVAGSFAVSGNAPDFVVAPVNSLLVDVLPGPVLTFSILTFGHLGDLLGFALALALSVLALAIVVLVGIALGRRTGGAVTLVWTVYLGTWAGTTALTRAPFRSLGAAVPMTLFVGLVAFGWLRAPGPVIDTDRRQLLVRVAGAVGFAGVAYAVGRRNPVAEPSRLSTIPAAQQAAIKSRLAGAESRSLDVPGLTGLVSGIDEFYEVDIDVIDPVVRAGDWTLSLTGAVETERTLSYDDLTAMAPTHQFVTLRCVGDELNGDLMDTALWTGVPFDVLLDEAGVTPDATYVTLRAADGYYEAFPLAALRDGLLAYGMNGRLLPRSHGHPARALVPGHWGEINVKWLTEIEVGEAEATSYWEERGWHGTGPVKTVAKLWAVEHLGDGRVRLGGYAYAGTRGISDVQVSLDGADSWQSARLSDPLDDPDTWRQWAYEYRPPAHAHTALVRAVDGDGTVQPRENASPFPSGPSGWVARTIQPE